MKLIDKSTEKFKVSYLEMPPIQRQDLLRDIFRPLQVPESIEHSIFTRDGVGLVESISGGLVRVVTDRSFQK